MRRAAPAVIGESSAASSEEVRVRNQVGKESARPRALLYVVPKVCASATWPFMQASPHPDKPGIPKSGCSYRWAKRRAALKRGPQSTARDSIKAGAPAFGCTVHPLRLQAPRAAYAHKSPGQGDCTATPGWPGGRDGRKSIKSKIIDTKAADCAIVGNMPYLRWTASPAKNVSPGRARMPPKDTPARSRLDMHLANFGETPERELRQNGVLRSSLRQATLSNSIDTPYEGCANHRNPL